ncbi:MAG TPA: glycosyltransferase [Pyrinomonadaceae bacterium]|nr:glycosyltransferase [Pyrinomonadaceae bacterium]
MYSHQNDDHDNDPKVINNSVSVVIPCYQQGRFLGDAIESALMQTYAPSEVIVVDDGSTDDTAAVATQYAAVRYLYQQNQGLSAARNTGLNCASGTYVNFLDADDRLLPHALETGARYLDANPCWAFIAGGHRLVSEDGSPLPWPKQWHVRGDYYRQLMHHNFIACHNSVMYRRDVLLSVGGFDETLPAGEDWDTYLRIAQKFPIHCHDEILSEYRQHSSNITRDIDLIMRVSMLVLKRHLQRINGDQEAEAACKQGLQFQEQRFRKDRMIAKMRADASAGRWGATTLDAVWLCLHDPLLLAENAGRKIRKALRG